MPVTPSYPGIYIEELPSNTHTITAAPTSITVFVGYTHPFKTNPANFENSNDNHTKAVRIFSFTDYEREFGGFYTSNLYDDTTKQWKAFLIDVNLAYAVNQFFLNGGSDAYVVGLKPQHYYDNSTPTSKKLGDINNAQKIIGGITFIALEPTDTDQTQMTITISNTQKKDKNSTSNIIDVADITIVYGKNGLRTETYRKVSLDSLESRINGISSLVKVEPPYPKTFPTTPPPISDTLSNPFPSGATNVFLRTDFTDVFNQDSDLDKVPIFNLLVIPGIIDNSILSEAIAFCERKQAFLILDPPRNTKPEEIDASDYFTNQVPRSTNDALYFPYIKSTDIMTGDAIELPPSGSVAGIYARTDLNRGVWKAPAGLETIINNTTGVVDSGRMNDPRQGVLNLDGIDCLRTFPGIGTVVYGARTLVSANKAFEQWKYVPVRRMALFIEQTLLRNLGWVVFEPNDEPLWAAIRLSIENFMLSLFRQSALQGSTPSQAFQVKCDRSTTTPDDQNNGIVNIVVAFAPLKPAEFVIIKIAQLASQVQA